jgi:hypothetical protein
VDPEQHFKQGRNVLYAQWSSTHEDMSGSACVDPPVLTIDTSSYSTWVDSRAVLKDIESRKIFSPSGNQTLIHDPTGKIKAPYKI